MTSRPQSRYAKLLARVKAATAEIGMKSALAEYLNVPPQRVSEWLSGKYEPGAEVALQMLEWVQAREVENKTPGNVRSTARSKQTRSRKSRETKPKPNPGKK